MKKIFKIFLIAFSSFLTATSLSACSFFSQKEEENSNQLVIDKASFVNTYTTITFDFKKDVNAIYYTAYFNGEKNVALSRIEPNTTYSIPSIPDGTYTVFLKAFANQNFHDSDLFEMGKLVKKKTAKPVEDFYIEASVNEEYGIDVTLRNKEKETGEIELSILKDNEIFITKTTTPNSTFSTEHELPAGIYTISAFFKETNEYLESSKVNYDGSLAIGKRQIELKHFSVNYSSGKVTLFWNSNANIPSSKKLSITYNGVTNEYTNYFKDSSITSGLRIDAAEYGEGEISFSLQLLSLDDTTYLDSTVESASTTISKYVVSSAPQLVVDYNESTGNLTINSPNYTSGTYHLNVSYETGNVKNNERLFHFDGDVTSFPITYEHVNLDWELVTYRFSLYKKSTNSLEMDSEATEVTKRIDAIKLRPNATIKLIGDISADSTAYFDVSTKTPSWANESWLKKEYSYIITFGVFLSQTLSIKEVQEEDLQYYLPDSLPKNYYELKIKINPVCIPEVGFVLEEINSGTYQAGSQSEIPDHLVSSFRVEEITNGLQAEGRKRFRCVFYCSVPYAYVKAEVLDAQNNLLAEEIATFSETSYSYGSVNFPISVLTKKLFLGKNILTFKLTVRFGNIEQVATIEKEVYTG